MKKEYIHPEFNIVSLVVEDNTNAAEIDDITVSFGDSVFDSIFGRNQYFVVRFYLVIQTAY